MKMRQKKLERLKKLGLPLNYMYGTAKPERRKCESRVRVAKNRQRTTGG